MGWVVGGGCGVRGRYNQARVGCVVWGFAPYGRGVRGNIVAKNERPFLCRE